MIYRLNLNNLDPLDNNINPDKIEKNINTKYKKTNTTKKTAFADGYIRR